jgi:hypothetical protein
MAAPIMVSTYLFPNASTRNTTVLSVVFSHLVLLTPIVWYPDRGGNYEMATEVSHFIMRVTLHVPIK